MEAIYILFWLLILKYDSHRVLEFLYMQHCGHYIVRLQLHAQQSLVITARRLSFNLALKDLPIDIMRTIPTA